MESFKAIFFKPDPKAQMRKYNSLFKAHDRALNRDIDRLKLVEGKTRNLIIAASKRAQRNPARAKDAAKETRIFAKELIQVRKQKTRLITSKAQLQSVRLQLEQEFSAQKIGESLQVSKDIMKNVNTLVKLPELTATMQMLSQELMKADVREEMLGDMMPDDDLDIEEDEEAEAEIEKVLADVLKTPQLPNTQISDTPAPAEEIDEDQEATLQQMRGRLEALKS